MTTLLATPTLFDALRDDDLRARSLSAVHDRPGHLDHTEDEFADGHPDGDPVGGEPTLDDLITGVWEGLATHHAAACPMCDGQLVPVYAAHARPVAGRCADCGTTLT